MEKDTVELTDFFGVIWRRKILIIAGTLVCIVVGVVTSLRLSETYRSDAVIKIGKKVAFKTPAAGMSSTLIYFESLADLAKTIPVKYGLSKKETLGYHLDARPIGGSSIRIILKGSDRGTEKVLKEIANRLVDDHRKTAEDSISQYKNLIKRLEVDARAIQDNITETEERLKAAKSIQKMIQDRIAVKEKRKGGASGVGVDMEAASIEMLYLRIEISYRRIASNEVHLREDRNSLREVQRELMMNRTFVDGFEKHRTERIGEVKTIAVNANKSRKIMRAGVVGLVMFVFLAFFIEYLARARERENNSVSKKIKSS